MTFQLPTYTEQGKAKLEYFQANARKLYDFLRAKQKEPGYKHDNGKWAHVSRPKANENLCATPVCALGWAVYEGICTGFDIHVFARAEYLPIEAHVTDEEIHAARLNCPHSTSIMVDLAALPDNKGAEAVYNMHSWNYDSAPVRDGELHEWGTVGKEFFGDAVYKAVFAQAELELDQVLNYLESFAANGWIEVEAETVDGYLPGVQAVRYFLGSHAAAAKEYFYNYDGTEGDPPPEPEE